MKKIMNFLKLNYKKIFLLLLIFVFTIEFALLSGSPIYLIQKYRTYINYFIISVTSCLFIGFILMLKFENTSDKKSQIFSIFKNVFINKKTIYLLFVVFIYLINFILRDGINRTSLNSFFVFLCFICSCYAISCLFDLKSIIKYFRIIFPILCIASIVVYTISYFSPVSPYFLPLEGAGESYNNFLFLAFQIQRAPGRNCGIFWEPALFGIFLNIGFVFEFVGPQKKPSIKNLIIYLVAILTTVSASAFIIFIPTCIYVISLLNKDKRKKYAIAMLLSIVLFICLIFLIPSLKRKITTASTSLVTRFYGPILSVKNVFTGNFFGVGQSNEQELFYKIITDAGLQNSIDCQSSSLSFYSLSFGIFGIILFLYPLYFVLFSKNNVFTKIYMSFIYILFVFAEPLQNNMIFTIIILSLANNFKKNDFISIDRNVYITIKEKLTGGSSNRSILAKNSFGVFAVKGLALLIGLFTANGYLKYFGTKDVLGVWLVLLQVITFALTFDLGIGNGLKNKLIQAFEKQDDGKCQKLINSAIVTSLVIGGFFTCFGFVFCYFVNFNKLFNISSELITNRELSIAMFIMFLSISLQFIFKLIGNIFEALHMQGVSSIFALTTTLSLFFFVNLFDVNGNGMKLIILCLVYLIVSNLPFAIGGIVLFKKKIPQCSINFKDADFQTAKSVVSLGVEFLFLQVCMLVIHNLNSWILSLLYSSESVPNYYCYEKVFNIVMTICSLLVGPIWAVVVKAKTAGDILWVDKLNKLIKKLTLILLGIDALFVVALPLLFLLFFESYGTQVNYLYALIFALFSMLMVISRFQCSISNGLENLKPQLVAASSGLVIKIICTVLQFVFLKGESYSNYWFLVQAASCLSMLPYVIIMPIANRKTIKNIKAQKIL